MSPLNRDWGAKRLEAKRRGLGQWVCGKDEGTKATTNRAEMRFRIRVYDD
jgi:hypothetical protein